MKYRITDFVNKFRSLAGDSTFDAPEGFLINTINWCFNELPTIPKLNKLFSAHYTANLRRGSYRWKINKDFRALNDILMMKFYTSTGGEPCLAKVCYLDNTTFYSRNGLVERKQPGVPCSYTVEHNGDDAYLVFDRPLGVPMVVDYIVTGYPMPIETDEDGNLINPDETREISAIAENLILALMRKLWYEEADDFAFSGAIEMYMDNKLILEAEQQLNKQFRNEVPRVLGGV